MFMLSSNEPVKVADLQKCDRNGKQFSKKLWWSQSWGIFYWKKIRDLGNEKYVFIGFY